MSSNSLLQRNEGITDGVSVDNPTSDNQQYETDSLQSPIRGNSDDGSVVTTITSYYSDNADSDGYSITADSDDYSVVDDDSSEHNVIADRVENATVNLNIENSVKPVYVLMDISCDKNWICYVRQSWDCSTKKTVFTLIRKEFVALDAKTEKKTKVSAASKQTGENNSAIAIDVDSKDLTLDITKYYTEFKGHTQFLSISADGKYIALSYYIERDESEEDKEDTIAERNSMKLSFPRCIIFKVENDFIIYYTELKKCDGRAVFLDRKDELCLTVINMDTLKLYSNFCKNKKNLSIYDLTPFRGFIEFFHQNFLEHTPWVNSNNNRDKTYVIRILNLSRLIRQDVLATPLVHGNILRLWSIKENGIRLASIKAQGREQILAVSKDLRYMATIELDGTSANKSVKIYNNKTSSLVHTLVSSYHEVNSSLDATHARFCYNSRYFALSGIQNTKTDSGCIAKVDIVFEIWDIGTEKSIYRVVAHSTDAQCKTVSKSVKPFVLRGRTDNGRKCLKGVYSAVDDENNNKTYYLELNIDDGLADTIHSTDDQVRFKWISKNNNWNKEIPYYEIANSLKNCNHLRCAKIIVGERKYLVRFGKHMIQLWMLGDLGAIDEEEKKDQLVYIRAYKGPNYGLAYSFRETWQIFDFKSIKYVGGTPAGRMLVNISEDQSNITEEEKQSLKGVYHTEEIFLPIESPKKKCCRFDSHTFESACQALHYLYRELFIIFFKRRSDYEITEEEYPLYCSGENNKKTIIYKYYYKNAINLYKKTKQIVINMLVNKKSVYSAYFTTMAGSRTLAMLASFDDGRELIKLILKSESSIPICIFSYARPIQKYHPLFSKRTDARLKRTRQPPIGLDTKEAGSDYRNSPTVTELIEGSYSPAAANENVLTVLIKQLDYDLYNLLFNRVIIDSKRIGPGCLSALTDALLFLQEEGNTDLLLTSGQKLSYLSLEENVLNIQTYEIPKVFTDETKYISNIRNLKSYSIMEQLHFYNIDCWNISDYIRYKLRMYLMTQTNWQNRQDMISEDKGLLFVLKECIKIPYRKLFNASEVKDPKNRAEICVVPLPYFNTYYILCEDRLNNAISTNNIYKKRSAFVAVASDPSIHNIFRQGDTVFEVMLQYKWKAFVKNRFIAVCAIHIAYYISYCTGVLFAFELYKYDPADKGRSISTRHLASILIMSISGLVLFGQEIHQICKSGRKLVYFKSGYNWVDLVALVLPFITLLQLRFNWNGFYELSSFSTLILWLHGVLRLRVFSFVGIALEIIIQLAQRVWSVLFILLLVVFGFTHSFIVLLKRREDTYFQEHYNGTTSLNTTNTPAIGNTSLYDISSTNGFTDPFKAFYQVWLLIFGVWDPVTNGDAGDDRMVFFLCILFALITVLIFSNMVIAIMSSVVDEVKRKGNAVWVSHFAAVVAEIEQLWCFPSTKRNRNNNPAYICYFANYLQVQKQEKMLADETKELKKKVLGIDDDDKRPKCNCQMS